MQLDPPGAGPEGRARPWYYPKHMSSAQRAYLPSWLTVRQVRLELLMAATLVLVVSALVIFGPTPNTRFASAARDFARFLLLATGVQSSLVILACLGKRAARSLVLIVGVAIGSTLFVEGVEALGGAMFSWTDIASAAVAVAAGAGIAAARLTGRRRWVGIATAIASGVIATAPFVGVVRSYRARDAAFPTLLDANRRDDIDWVRTQAVPVHLEPWSRAATSIESPMFVVPLEGSPQPGVAIDEPYPNWTGQKVLKLDLGNPGGQPLDLVLNVDDMLGSGNPGDRFDRKLRLLPHSRQTYEIALQDIVRAIPHRRFALDDMDIVRVYSEQAIPGGRLLVARIWLE